MAFHSWNTLFLSTNLLSQIFQNLSPNFPINTSLAISIYKISSSAEHINICWAYYRSAENFHKVQSSTLPPQLPAIATMFSILSTITSDRLHAPA